MSRNAVGDPHARTEGAKPDNSFQKYELWDSDQRTRPGISAVCGNDTYPQEPTRTRDEQIGPYLLFDTVCC